VQGLLIAFPGIETAEYRGPLVDWYQRPVPSPQDDRPRDQQAGMWQENYQDEVCLAFSTACTQTK
jgi:hypothetical protein